MPKHAHESVRKHVLEQEKWSAPNAGIRSNHNAHYLYLHKNAAQMTATPVTESLARQTENPEGFVEYFPNSVVQREPIKMPDGYETQLYAWQPTEKPKAVVIGLHGINDYGMAFDLPANVWLAHGVSTISVDQRGYGCTQGRGAWHGQDKMVRDIGHVTDLVHQRHPDVPLFLLGESMGASLAILFAESAAEQRFTGFILSSPPMLGQSTLGALIMNAIAFGAMVAPNLRFGFSLEKSTATDNRRLLKLLNRDPFFNRKTKLGTLRRVGEMLQNATAAAHNLDVPFLVLLGKRDRRIDRRLAQKLFTEKSRRQAGRSSVLVYEDGFHLLFRDHGRALPISDTAAWILETLDKNPERTG